jgi:hypothetical protein
MTLTSVSVSLNVRPRERLARLTARQRMRNIPSNRPAHSSQALLLQCNITDVATVAGKVKGFLLHCTKILDYQDNLDPRFDRGPRALDGLCRWR